jgi:hypothetical protein
MDIHHINQATVYSSSHTDDVHKAIKELHNITEPRWNLKPAVRNDDRTDGTNIDRELECCSTDSTLSISYSQFPLIHFHCKPIVAMVRTLIISEVDNTILDLHLELLKQDPAAARNI